MGSWSGDFPSLRRELAVLEILPEASSTNDVLKSEQHFDYSGVLTGHQISGRGRLGRSWVSAPDQGLALSFVVPTLSPRQQQWLPLVTGAALITAAHSKGIPSAQLKWPNDVLVEERKLAGILCEVRTDGRVIVGTGINIDFAGGEPPSPGATSLAAHAQVSHVLVDNLLANLVASVRAFCEESEQEALIAARKMVNGVLATLGRRVSVLEVQGTEWKGLALSLTEDGHLLVREAETGGQRAVIASDVRHLRQ